MMPRALLLLVFWVFFAVPCVFASTAESVLRVAYVDFPPFHSRDENGHLRGLLYDIVTEAVQKRLGVPLVWEPGPWARCQERVERGQADAMITVPTAERARYTVTHKTPLYLKTHVLFTYAGHPRLERILALGGIEDIRAAGFRVITYVGNGWSRTHLAGAGVEVLEAPSRDAVWRMLAARRGDLVAECPVAACMTLRGLVPEGAVVQTPVVLETLPFHLLVGKNSPLASFLPQLSDILRAMHADGSMERILSSYR